MKTQNQKSSNHDLNETKRLISEFYRIFEEIIKLFQVQILSQTDCICISAINSEFRRTFLERLSLDLSFASKDP